MQRAKDVDRALARNYDRLFTASLLGDQDICAEALFEFIDQHQNRSDMRSRGSGPIESAALPGIDEANRENRDKDHDFDKTEHPEPSQLNRVRIKKDHFHVENQEQQ